MVVVVVVMVVVVMMVVVVVVVVVMVVTMVVVVVVVVVMVFKVTPLFDAKYLTNGYRYGHSYYRRRLGNAPKLSNGTILNYLV